MDERLGTFTDEADAFAQCEAAGYTAHKYDFPAEDNDFHAWFRCGVHAEHFAGCGAGVVLIGCPVRGSLVSGPRIDYCEWKATFSSVIHEKK
jgi:hypothetical protein